jgi:hypothetical protein
MEAVIALIGSKALWITYAWLLSAIVCSYISERKGYSEKGGLAAGLLLNVVGIIVWVLIPAKPDSRWKLQGVFGRGGMTVAEARAQHEHEHEQSPQTG